VVVSAGLKLSQRAFFQPLWRIGAGGAVQLGPARQLSANIAKCLAAKVYRHDSARVAGALIEESLRLPDPPPWTHSGRTRGRDLLALAHASGAWLVTGNLNISEAVPSRGHRAFRRQSISITSGNEVLSRSRMRGTGATRRRLDFLKCQSRLQAHSARRKCSLINCLIQRIK